MILILVFFVSLLILLLPLLVIYLLSTFLKNKLDKLNRLIIIATYKPYYYTTSDNYIITGGYNN